MFDRGSYCGLLCWRPQCLQSWANIRVFTGLSASVMAMQGAYLGYMIGVLTTIEQQYGMSSSESGALLSLYDMGQAIAILFVGIFGNRLHQPMTIGIMTAVTGIALFCMSLPQFIWGTFNTGMFRDPSKHEPYPEVLMSICAANGTDLDDLHVDNAKSNSGLYAYVIFSFCQVAAGVCSSAYSVLTYVFIDDNCKPSMTSWYIGIISSMWGLGPAIGLSLSAFCTNIHVTLGTPEGLTPTSPLWIGAWWLGHLVIGTLNLLLAGCFLMFPKNLRNRTKLVNDPSSATLMTNSESLTNNVGSDRSGSMSIRELMETPKKLCALFGNPVFLGVALCWSAEAFVQGGYDTFLPKYLEVHFKQTVATADLYTGLLSVCGLAAAVAIGGRFVSWFRPRPATGLLLIAVAKMHSFMTSLVVMIIKCPTAEYNSWLPDDAWTHPLTPSITDQVCNVSTSCDCDTTVFQPVCYQNRNYFTPCQLGCSTFNYMDCACTPNQTDAVFDGVCMDTTYCGTRTATYLAAAYIAAFVSMFFYMAGYNAMIRSVKPDHKALTLALANTMMSLLGYIPSQVVFGALIDSTCAYWSHDAETEHGHCALYYQSQFRRRFHVATACIHAVAMLSTTYAFLKAKRFKFQDLPESDADWELDQAQELVERGQEDVETIDINFARSSNERKPSEDSRTVERLY